MAAAQENPRASHVPSLIGQEYNFPQRHNLSPTTSPLRRPASTSSMRSGNPEIFTSSPSDGVPTPAASPTAFTFPTKSALAAGTSGLPNSPPQSPNPPGEHARRQSESTVRFLSNGGLSPNFTFGGGVSKAASASPSKASLSPTHSLSPPIEKGTAAPPPAGMARRGHAHRRSAAMSSGDVLSVMLNPATPSRQQGRGSAPTSPSLDKATTRDPMEIDNIQSRPHSAAGSIPFSPPTPASLPSSPVLSGVSDLAGGFADELPRKSRVTFNDAPEIIPRPASAGTCSTITTVRAGSTGGSISSMASFTPSEFGSPDKRRASASDAASSSSRKKVHRPKELQRRPSSADASTILHSAMKSSWIFPPLSPSKPASSKPSKKKGSSKGSSKHSKSGSGSFKGSFDVHPDSRKNKSSMKGWAGSILLRRHHRKRQLRTSPRRSPTPPMMQRDEIQRLMNGGSYVLMPPNATEDEPRPSYEDDDMDIEAQIDLGDYDSDDDEERSSGDFDYPIIDLDAALGPFNTPTSPNIPVGFNAAKLRMHSAAGWAPFHRRAESMPEMQLFSLAEDEIEDDGMGDVFEDSEAEELEEDDFRPSTDSEASQDSSQDQMQWSTTGVEGGEDLDVLDGVALARKELKRKMSLVIEVNDGDETGASTSQQDLGLEDSVATLTPQMLTSPPASPLPTPPCEPEPFKRSALPFHLASITQWAYSTLGSDQNGYENSNTAESTPLVTPSSGTMSASTPTTAPSPPTPQHSEFLIPPRAPSLVPDDDRSTLVSVPSIYEDPVLLGEPGPEMRLSISMDDIPRITHSSSAAVLGFYPQFNGNSSAVTVPGVVPRSRGSMSTTATDHAKDKRDKKWGKFFNFWRTKS